MFRRLTKILLLFIAIYIAESFADELVSPLARPDDLASGNPHFVIVRAEILELSAAKTSFENPASSKIKIIDVLRGRDKMVPRDALAQFNPPLNGKMMINPRDGNYELKPEAKAQQFDMPDLGSQVLISYCCVDGENAISTQGKIIAWSVQNEAIIRSSMAPPEASPKLQGGLFIGLLATTVFGLLLGVIETSTKLKFTLRSGVFIASLILYITYEAGVSIYTNIRVDLLLIYPLLFLNLLWLIWALISFGKSYRHKENV
ncbi:MAG TPA: hypothetical protein VF268_06790 [Gammaproteobacteria bacterium]